MTPANSRFDAIARGLAGGMSRREALRVGGAAFVGAVAVTPADAWAALTGRCPSRRVECHGVCCPKGEVCRAPKRKGGKHRCGCPPQTRRCAGRCVNLEKDSNHCGTCGHKCGPGQRCVEGACTCAAGEALCSGACVSLSSDPKHCGACGNACSSGQVCVSGQCSSGCPAGQTACAGVCVQLSSNPQHCGACGTVCAAGGVCVNGVCATQCSSGQTNCGGTCVDLSSDPSHCGSCATACATGATCAGGACMCPAGKTSCGGTCVDLQTDFNHCGACGTVCSNFFATSSCVNGTCHIDSCAPNWLDCDKNPLNGCEFQGTVCPP